ncbi:hypothetical protein P8C59_008115 [Phyllachora maydis]|uniref:Glycoside hydrolase family 76 protein n=1 Tax=Phyllachora maydis TaxID=1825666 RepID=A0AAD9IAV0_9PEZI|nr:hypothetical protein P8C59_008115 [Phyllachora maydis]
MASHLSAALGSIAHLEPDIDYRVNGNTIDLYFSQLVSFYFGQDAFALRGEAFDDMLWVVLGWLDAVQFITLHSTLQHRTGSLSADLSHEPSPVLPNESWYGTVWIPAFAHRARVFWELASAGWDTTLCRGGMGWNPRLEPYKNAITNELFIAASINMYLHFPGDANPAPFSASSGIQPPLPGSSLPEMQEWPARDVRYLVAAIEGYEWLTTSGMVNDQGLYTDGFHISGSGNPSSNNTQCDQRNDMVYTYNQGVLLTGQLGLFQVTGMSSYIDDGHDLVRSVIAATGWDLDAQRPIDDLTELLPGQLPPWRGLGRAGVLEDVCDVVGDCSQDSQTFKGIYMHHLTTFCAPLALAPGVEPAGLSDDALQKAQRAHLLTCRAYTHWLRHNARAALGTRDAGGRYGMWWTAGLLSMTTTTTTTAALGNMPNQGAVPSGANATDYRTHGVPVNSEWMYLNDEEPVAPSGGLSTGEDGQHPLAGPMSVGESSDVIPRVPASDTAAAGPCRLDPRARLRHIVVVFLVQHLGKLIRVLHFGVRVHPVRDPVLLQRLLVRAIQHAVIGADGNAARPPLRPRRPAPGAGLAVPDRPASQSRGGLLILAVGGVAELAEDAAQQPAVAQTQAKSA